ncbi:MAG: molecular chaperone HtpG [Alphaproteobacteria bacterium]
MATTDTATGGAPAGETHAFQAEVSRLLEIVAHSLYSNREIFLRELISNASDACDKLRYEALTQPALLDGDAELAISIAADTTARTLTVRDNGIGMDRDELAGNLGTIARSGTAAFVEALGAAGGKSDMSLIGQFGVGFYSVFMVADRVEVVSRKAGAAESWRWTSDGKGTFTIEAGPADAPRGTAVTLHLKKDAAEFAEAATIRRVVKTYSDHVALPVRLAGDKPEQLNAAGALWMRPRAEITEEQYKEFYHHVAHAFDDPWLTLHARAEGTLEYTSLLFVPGERPFDLFDPERKHRVKLYVRRIFITDNCEGLLPAWLRFVRGVVDSEDLPLNVSREVLQANPVVAKIRQGLVRRVLGELKKKAESDKDGYAKFWDAFGAVLKEGLYEDSASRKDLLALVRMRVAGQDGWKSFDDYIASMASGQTDIYYITGDDAEALAASPQLEAFRARGIPVLLLTDPIDEFWITAVGEVEGKHLRSITRADISLAGIGTEPEEQPGEKNDDKAAGDATSRLVALFKLALGDAVRDVRTSERLTDSAVCLVAAEGDPDMHLERLLRQHRRFDGASRRILEINPRHAVIRRLAATVSAAGADANEAVNDAAFLLLDQARIAEGEPPADPRAFARRLAAAIERGLAPAA